MLKIPVYRTQETCLAPRSEVQTYWASGAMSFWDLLCLPSSPKPSLCRFLKDPTWCSRCFCSQNLKRTGAALRSRSEEPTVRLPSPIRVPEALIWAKGP